MHRALLPSGRLFLYSFKRHPAKTMKFQYSVLATALASSSALLEFAPSAHAFAPVSTRYHMQQSISCPSARSFSLNSLAAPEAEVAPTPALTPTGKQMASGSVVSYFRGGLVAVKIDNDERESIVDGSSASLTGSSSPGGDLMGHQVIFPDGTVGVIVTHRAPVVFVYCDMDQLGETEGTVKVLDSLASLTVSDGVKISDCFGRALKEGSSPDGKVMKRAIFAAIPQVKDIALINTPMVTGVTMLDALAPIGKGQNMLMIGHDLKDMRGYVVDLLSAQKGKTKCIYAATTDKDEITTMLVEAGLLDVVLVAQDGKADKDEASGAAESTTIAAAACAIGESFALEKGENALVIIDTIDQHKKLWDSTTRVLVDVFGIDAVVKGDLDGGASSEMRAFYSTLIQRSAQYKKNRGGGSVTVLLMTTIPKLAGGDDGTVYYPSDFENSSAKTRERIDLLAKKNIPLTAATLRKIEIPIPSDTEGKRRLVLQHVDDLISMSDGQIWFDEKLEAGGRRPPMDPTRSVTRVGIGADTPSRADAPAMRRVVEGLRLNLAQAASMDGADFALTSSQKQLRKSNALLLAMHQEAQSGARMLSESCTVLLAATKGHLDGTVDKGIVAGSAEGDKIISDLLKHVSSTAPGALAEIDETEDMSEDCMKEIEAAIESFFSSN